MKKTICGENCPNYKHTNKEIFNTLDEDEALKLADVFKVFSDTTRIKIICTILNKELKVSQICDAVKMNRTTVSHQLKTLRESGLVKYRKEGTQIYYSLKNAHVEQIIMQAIDHLHSK